MHLSKNLLKRTNRLFQYKRFSTQQKFNDDIPQSLKYDREWEMSTTQNGIRVCSEYFPTEVMTICVFINCGSRQESEQTSGSAHFLEHLHFKGTNKRTRTQLELEVENMGGQLNAYTSRENTCYTINVFNSCASQAVEILSDMLTNSLYSTNSLENERDTIFRELVETQKETFETLIEISHQVSYPNHQLGRPILGEIGNIMNINRDMVVDYHDQFYRGDNMVVVGAGAVPHQQLVDLVQKYFGGVIKQVDTIHQEHNIHVPQFHPGVSFVKAELLEVPPQEINVGVFHQAPSWHQSDYYAFLLLQRLLGDKPQLELESQLYGKSDINSFQRRLSYEGWLENQKSAYTPYSNTGLFGNYYSAQPQHLQALLKLNQDIYQEYSQQLCPAEVQRAKNRLYVELLQHESGDDIAQSIGNQLLYLNRRVSKQEIALRIQSYSPEHLSQVAHRWLNNNNYSVTVWGNVAPLYKQFNISP